MKQLMILVAMSGLVACEDAKMNLGPDASAAGGGTAGATHNAVGAAAGRAAGGTGGVVTPEGGAGGISTVAGAGGAVIVGGAGAGGAGGVVIVGGAGAGGDDGTAGAAGATPQPGIELAGLQRFTVTVSGGMPLNFDGVCRGWEPEIYALDLQTKSLTFEHCAVAADGVTATRAQESRVLSDAEITGALMHLRLVAISSRLGCGADKPSESLELDFGSHRATYLDDFYSYCRGTAPVPGVIFVTHLDELIRFLDASGKYAGIPSEYDNLTFSVVPPDSVNEYELAEACPDAYRENYSVDFVEDTITATGCGYSTSSGLFAPYEHSRALTATEAAAIRASVEVLSAGASDDCHEEQSIPLLNLVSNQATILRVVGAQGACPWSRMSGFLPAFGLEAFRTLLESYVAPPPVPPQPA